MALTVRTPEILDAARAAHAMAIHTCLPGVVVDYDPATQTASVQPVIKVTISDVETGDPADSETLPTIPLVPVVFPQGGGFAIHWDLVKGDHVVLVFSEAGTGHWRESGEISEPGDTSRHSLSYPFAIPGTGPDSKALHGPADPTNSGKLVMGQDGTAQTKVIKIGPSGIELGGPTASVVPIALGPPMATQSGALGVGWTALATAFTALAAAHPADAAVYNTAGAAAGVAATACGVAATAVPATLVKAK